MIEKARDDGEHAATPADVAIPLTPTDLLRLPRSEAADERLIAAANHRRLEIAAARLQSTFDSIALLVADAGVRTPEQIGVRDLPGPTELWELVDDLFVHEDMRPPHLAFELTDASVDDQVDMRASYDVLRPDVHAVASKLAGGAALLLRWVDEYHPRLWAICSAIETMTGAHARLSLYIVPAGSRGVPEAPDNADRVIIPIDGELGIEMNGFGASAVVPGFALATPCGQRVTVSATNEVMILVLDVGRVRAADLIDLAGENARYFPAMRADVPASIGGPIHSYDGSIFDTAGSFRDTAAKVLTQDSLERAAAIRRSQLPNRIIQYLSDVLAFNKGADKMLLAPHSGGLLIAEGPEGVHAAISGMRLTLPADVTRAISPYLDGRSFAASELHGVLNPLDVDAEFIVRTLVEVEVLQVMGQV